MKIVIDLPNENYQVILTKIMLDSNGCKITEIPKGHGRLIDADSMKTMKNIQSANFNAVELIRLWIDSQPTIIEADKGAENE